MKIVFKKSFEKQYVKLTQWQKENVNKSINIFMDNPKNPILKNHSLKGRLKGKNSISVSHDMRIVFIEHDNYYLVEFLALWSHNQVY